MKEKKDSNESRRSSGGASITPLGTRTRGSKNLHDQLREKDRELREERRRMEVYKREVAELRKENTDLRLKLNFAMQNMF